MAYLNNSLCLTPDCVLASSNILQNLASNYQSLDPCEDFNQYVCGGFPTRFHQGETSTLGEMRSNNVDLIKRILDSGNSSTSEASADGRAVFEMLSDSYKACMDVENGVVEVKVAIEAVTSQIISLFPIDNSSYGSNATLDYRDRGALVKLQAYLNTVGIDGFLAYSTFQNIYNDTSTYLPSVGPLKDDGIQIYNATSLGQIFKTILPSETGKSSAETIAQSVLDLHEALNAAAAELTTGVADSILYYPWQDVQELAPGLSIDQVIEALIPTGYKPEAAILPAASYLQNISTLLSQTPKATIQAFFLLRGYIVVTSAFTQITKSDPWTECEPHLEKTMKWPLSKVYLDAVYDENDATLVNTIIEDLRSSFKDRVQNASWITETTREVVLNKLASIKKHITYPTEDPNLANATSILSFYEGFEVGSSHFNNTISYAKWNSAKNWNNLVDPYKGWPIDGSLAQTNAFYSPYDNAMYFLASILRAPLFSTKLPAYLTYGGFGTVSGHELTHGFDASGSRFNAQGLLNLTQFDNETLAAFEERKSCFIDQFNGYELHVDLPVPGVPATDPKTNGTLHVNGNATVNENIADAGGIAMAYMAWKKRATMEPQNNQMLPGLDAFTADQLFFVSYGQAWCHRDTETSLQGSVIRDTHAPGEGRIRSIMENSRWFKQAFNCPKKDPVCELW